MTYPLQTNTPETKKFEIGRWYECTYAFTPHFTEGKVYLCMDDSKLRISLVTNFFRTCAVSSIQSKFRPAVL